MTTKQTDVRINLGIFLLLFVTFHTPFYGSFATFIIELILINSMTNQIGIKDSFSELISTKVKFMICIFIGLMCISIARLYFTHGYGSYFFYSTIRGTFLLGHLALAVFYYMYIVGTKNNSCPATPVVYASLAAILVTVATSFNFDLRSALVDGEMLVSNNRRYLGYFVMVASIATSTYILLSSEDRKYYILSGLTFAFLVWIGGRGAVIAFTSTMLLLIALLVYLKQLKIRLLFFLLISLFIGCLLSIPLNIYHWNGLIRFVSDNEGLMGLQSSSSLARLELWSESIELFLAKPLLGYGPEAHHFNTQIGYLQPHNFILQWLVEFGLLGTMCLLYLIYSILIKALKQSLVSTTAINKVSLFCAIGLLIQALVDGNLYHGAPTALFVLLCVSASVNIHLPPHVERNNKNVTSSFTSVKE